MARPLSGSRTLAGARVLVAGRKQRIPDSGSPIGGSSTAPVISNIVVTPSDTGAVVSWHLDQGSQGWVEYGPSAAYGTETTHENSFTYVDHVQTIAGLTAGSTYHLRIHAVNAASQATLSADVPFTTTTSSPPVPPPTGGPTYIQTVAGPTSGTIASLQSAVNALADGTSTSLHRRLLCPAGATYTGTAGLSVAGRQHITIDFGGTPTAYGNTGGATVHATGDGNSIANSTIIATGANDVRILNGNFVGSNPFAATNKSWNGTTTSSPIVLGERQHGLTMYGGTNVEVGYSTFTNMQGDGFYHGDGGPQTIGFWWHNSTVDRNGRMGCAPKHTKDMTVEDSLFRDISMYVWDPEPSNTVSTVENCIFRRNRVEDYGWSTAFGNSFIFGLAADAGAVPTFKGFTIDANTIAGVNRGAPTNIAGCFDFRHANFIGPLFIRDNVCTRAKLPGWAVNLTTGTGPAVITNNTGFLSSGGFIFQGSGYTGTVTAANNS